MLKERHRKEQLAIVEEFKMDVGECKANILGFVENDFHCKMTKEMKEHLDKLDRDKQLERLTALIEEKSDVLKRRYRAVRSSLVKRQQHEVHSTTTALVAAFARLDSIRNEQLENIHAALHIADKAVEHCVPLVENAHKAAYNQVLRARADCGIQHARIALSSAFEKVAAECSKIRQNYRTVYKTGPIEQCIANPSRPSSAYPGLILSERLPAMPSCVRHRPGSSKRPSSGMSRNIIKKTSESQRERPPTSGVQVRGRPKSAPAKPNPISIKGGRENHVNRPASAKIEARPKDNIPYTERPHSQERPISAAGLKIKTRMQALREAAQQNQESSDDVEANQQNEHERHDHEIDDEIYDEEYDSEEDKNFENSIVEMSNTLRELRDSQSRELNHGLTKKKKKKKKLKKASYDSSLTDSYDAVLMQRKGVCPECKKKYFGDGVVIPSISSLDKHVSTTMRVKEIVGKRENVDVLTKVEKEIHDRRERNKAIYDMKVQRVPRFCSWECVKARSHTAVPKSYRYEVYQLIDLYAGYIVN